MNLFESFTIRTMSVCAIVFTSCLLAEISSVPTPTPHPLLPFEVQHAQAIGKLNLTKQQFTELASRFSYILSDPVNEFSKNFFRTLAEKRENDNKNIIVSPFSIHAALSMLFFGSPKNTTTNHELAEVLKLSIEDNKSQNYLFNYLYLLKFYNDARRIYDTEVELANKIFLQDGFVPKDHFKTLLEAFYLTSTQSVNFGQSEDAVDAINEYVKTKTRGLIEEIITPQDVSILTRLVLVNAIYFKANWKYQFNKRFTAPMFYNLLGNEGRVKHEKGMQVSAAFRSSISEKLNAKILELPYESADFNMYIMIPKNNSLESLNQIAMSYDMEDIQNSLKSSPKNQQLKVYMPAFETTFKTGLKETLASMGINTLFNNADLGDIADESLYVSDVLHKAQVKVNEEGSEAAAATAVVVNTRSGGPRFRQIPEFRVDQPFVYIIHDKTNNLPLFIGRIINPTEKTVERQVEDTTKQQLEQLSLSKDPQQDHGNRRHIVPSQKQSGQEDQVNKNAGIPSGSTEFDCEQGKQHNVSDHEDAVTFPCKGRDTDIVERADDLKRAEESEKLKKFQELSDVQGTKFR